MKYPYENLENFTLSSLLDRSLELYADNNSFANVGQKAMNFKEFNASVHHMVKLLKQNGIVKGDKVLLLSENMPHWGIAYFAVTYFGGVIVPVLPDFHPEDVHRIIYHSEVKAAFVSSRYEDTIRSCEDSNLMFSINLNSFETIDSLSNQKYMSKLTLPDDIDTIEKPKEDDLASLIYTSGTTGNSKGVMLSHKNLVTNAMSAHVQLTITAEDVFLSVLPLAHTFECTTGLLIPVLHGSSVYYIDKVPTPSVLLNAFSVVKPTMILMVPLLIEKIYKNKILPKFTSSWLMRFLYSIGFLRKILNKIAGKKLIETFGGRVRFCGIGGAGLSPFVEEFLIEAKFPFIIGYGLTETSPLLAGSILGKPAKFKSTGVAMGGVELKIKDKDPQTGKGEIIAKSSSVMIGYYKDAKQTNEVIKDGWFHTGDLGYIDEDGYLFISGRSKNVLIGAGGENIYPEQIEAIINQHELVLDSLMMMQNSQLIAKIHLNYEHINHNDKEEIIELLEKMRKNVNAQISSFSRMVKFVEQEEEFIKTPTKKIKRYLYTN
ncbi:MAG: long-chain acyl-CoA synthetase [Sulfurimonas sp.]|jgi:long-chain acyl-CoA synthetase|uniref:AMP-binding protein n=1 Tax=Sulfurimonas sp. TaxID=2022749 RepID=UPI0039E3F9F1